MGEAMNGPTLLAMAPSGEIVMVRDTAGRCWVQRSPAAGGRKPIDEEVAREAVAYHGFLWVDRSFPSWQALEEYRQETAAQVAPDVPVDRDLDADDARRLLAVGRRWVADGEGSRARQLATKLLRVPAVRADGDLHDDVVSLLEQVPEPRLDWRTEGSNPHQAAARERWRQTVAA